VIVLNLWIFSKALYSTWVYYSPERVLFDAGEGVATKMSNKIYAIKNIFITHGHVDHILGIWGIINTRNNAMGDREKVLNIYYPKGSKSIENYLNFINKANPDLKFNFVSRSLEPGEIVELRNAGSFRRFVVPFSVKHSPVERSFGYHIVETRKRLKSEYKNCSEQDIKNLLKSISVDEITETYNKNVLTISGDTVGVPKSELMNTETLIHECTFMDIKDRKQENHSYLGDVIENVKGTGIKRLILYHISGRYSKKIEKYLKVYADELRSMGIELYYVYPERDFTL
jgi:ribonuclease Z